jgi:hypothetical protein
MKLQTRVNGFHRTGHPVRRRNLRIPCQVPAQVQNAEQRVCGVCMDLSLGGMLFAGPLISVGERIQLTLELGSVGPIRLAGEVLDHRRHAEGTRSAIRFPVLSQSDLKAINRFVAGQIA